MNEHLAPLLEEVRRILAEADAEIAARKPVCRASGRCCRFDEYGHRLYVTTAELAYFRRLHPPPAPPAVALPQYRSAGGCPYQVDNLCTAREGRPLGCRVYFCDAAAQGWQNDLYERYHARLAALHEAFGLAYQYVEWRAALGSNAESE